jgi:hypothetical protein
MRFPVLENGCLLENNRNGLSQPIGLSSTSAPILFLFGAIINRAPGEGMMLGVEVARTPAGFRVLLGVGLSDEPEQQSTQGSQHKHGEVFHDPAFRRC